MKSVNTRIAARAIAVTQLCGLTLTFLGFVPPNISRAESNQVTGYGAAYGVSGTYPQASIDQAKADLDQKIANDVGQKSMMGKEKYRRLALNLSLTNIRTGTV